MRDGRPGSVAVAIDDPEGGSRCQQQSSAQRFKELIGVTPKRLARTYRFVAAVFSIKRRRTDRLGRPRRWDGLLRPGHFGHEFWAFTGLTPTQYVEDRRRFLREHPGHALD